jgi:hypothetical protein
MIVGAIFLSNEKRSPNSISNLTLGSRDRRRPLRDEAGASTAHAPALPYSSNA